jgi:hypothetical protein
MNTNNVFVFGVGNTTGGLVMVDESEYWNRHVHFFIDKLGRGNLLTLPRNNGMASVRTHSNT